MSEAGPPATDVATSTGQRLVRAPRAPSISVPPRSPRTGRRRRCSVTVTPVLSYALAHNRIAVVHRVEIANPGAAVGAATLRLQVEDATGPIGGATDALVDLPEAGSTALTQPQVWLDPTAMARIEEQRPGAVRATLLIERAGRRRAGRAGADSRGEPMAGRSRTARPGDARRLRHAESSGDCRIARGRRRAPAATNGQPVDARLSIRTAPGRRRRPGDLRGRPGQADPLRHRAGQLDRRRAAGPHPGRSAAVAGSAPAWTPR